MVEELFQGGIFFVSGVVCIVLVVGLVYCISWSYDRASSNAAGMLTPDELEERRKASGLVRGAGLAGLLPEEQLNVIRHFFQSSAVPYVEEMDKATQKGKVVDIEAQNVNTEETGENELTDVSVRLGTEDENVVAKNSGVDDAKQETNDDTTSGDSTSIDNVTIELSKGDEATSATPAIKDEEDEVDIEAHEGEMAKAAEEISENLEDKASVVDDGEVNDDAKESSEATSEENIEAAQPADTTEKADADPDSDTNAAEKKEETETSNAALVEEEAAEEGVCSICLGEYEKGEKVVVGSTCNHMFHLECYLQWLEKKPDECPFCRSSMMTSDQFLASAYFVLGDKRVRKLRNINAEAERRMREWAIKQSMEAQQQQEQAEQDQDQQEGDEQIQEGEPSPEVPTKEHTSEEKAGEGEQSEEVPNQEQQQTPSEEEDASQTPNETEEKVEDAEKTLSSTEGQEKAENESKENPTTDESSAHSTQEQRENPTAEEDEKNQMRDDDKSETEEKQ